MEKGDIIGLVGMVLGIGAATNIFLYILFYQIPFYQSMWWLFQGIFYATILGSGIAGLILSIIGISKNRSKFGIVGLITSAFAIAVFITFL
ncbi:MAG: hypothetical protein ACTSRS_03865 [Candidatus Helarchaeota archaeon]